MEEGYSAIAASAFPAIPGPTILHKSAAEEWNEFINREIPEPPMLDRSTRQFASAEQADEKLGMKTHPLLRHLFVQPRFEQRSEEWHTARQTAITASDFGAASGDSEYGNPVSVFRKKTESKGDKITDPRALAFMAHGTKYEDAAAFRYEKESGKKIIDFGLLSHWKLWEARPSHITPTTWFHLIHKEERPDELSPELWEMVLDLRWLKGSPDGITADGILIEIKCPSAAWTPGVIKRAYLAQVQVNMEVAGVDVCHFIQYAPQKQHMFSERYDCFEVHRDGSWFAIHKEVARKTWDWVLEYRKTGILPAALMPKIRQVPDPEGMIVFESTRKRKASEVLETGKRLLETKGSKSVAPGIQFAPFDDGEEEWSATASKKHHTANGENDDDDADDIPPVAAASVRSLSTVIASRGGDFTATEIAPNDDDEFTINEFANVSFANDEDDFDNVFVPGKVAVHVAAAAVTSTGITTQNSNMNPPPHENAVIFEFKE